MSVKKKYADLLTDPRWQKKRLKILERDEWTCHVCGAIDQTLHIHHYSYNGGNPWDVEDSKLITLCEGCHYVVSVIPDEFIRAVSKMRKRQIMNGRIKVECI